jgi:hypothetical protein
LITSQVAQRYIKHAKRLREQCTRCDETGDAPDIHCAAVA